MTEREKMIRGELYDPTDPELVSLRLQAHRLCKAFNRLDEEERQERAAILKQLLPRMEAGSSLSDPIFFDYGLFTTIGRNCWFNVNLTVLDTCPVTIGDNVMVGPNCSILTPVHPLIPEERNQRRRPDGSLYDLEYAKPVVIEDDCWIAGNVTILGGVTIGRGTVIGAGSVVSRDIPAGVLAVGNPCRVLRPLRESDRLGIPPEPMSME